MNTKEFRLGNYLMDAVSKEWMIVDEIGERIGAVLINRDRYPLPDGWQMTEIPMTPELLLKCSYTIEIDEGGKYYYLNANRYTFVYKESFGHYVADHKPIDISIRGLGLPINYLHQLQNLYFALTGEELTIKL